MKATDRPWEYNTGENGSVVYNSDIGTIATLSYDYGTPDEANAALIVQAVNAHDALVEALDVAEELLQAMHKERTEAYIDEYRGRIAACIQTIHLAYAALKLAGGDQC